jgi:hypothetical protein
VIFSLVIGTLHKWQARGGGRDGTGVEQKRRGHGDRAALDGRGLQAVPVVDRGVQAGKIAEADEANRSIVIKVGVSFKSWARRCG